MTLFIPPPDPPAIVKPLQQDTCRVHSLSVDNDKAENDNAKIADFFIVKKPKLKTQTKSRDFPLKNRSTRELTNLTRKSLDQSNLDYPQKKQQLKSEKRSLLDQDRDRLLAQIISQNNINDRTLPLPLMFDRGSSATRLLTQERRGKTREFEFSSTPQSPKKQPINSNSTSEKLPDKIIPTNVETVKVVEVLADRQEYDDRKQIITARGNVVMRFDQALLIADRLEVNLINRIAVARGNVILTRGEQTLRGEKFEYYFAQDKGVIFNANGEVYQPTAARDLSPNSPIDDSKDNSSGELLSDRLRANQPLRRITTSKGYQFVVGSNRDFDLLEDRGGIANPDSGGNINRLRFQAERIDFNSDSWTGKNLRLTNDPFSPPELEVRADRAEFKQTAPQVQVLTTSKSRLVFDRNTFVPLLFTDRFVFDGRPQGGGLFSFGFDGDDRGGLFIERSFRIIDNERVSFKITPQYFLQKAIVPEAFGLSNNNDTDGSILRSSLFGLRSKLDIGFSDRTTLSGKATLLSLDGNDLEDKLRGKIALKQKFGDLKDPYTLRLDYSYRERIFNGSLGFQPVFSRFGTTLNSPDITIGKTGIELDFEGSIQNISADTDRSSLLDEDRDNDRVNLTRYQGVVSLNKDFPIWEGETLPPTQDKGLRYTNTPVLPYLQLVTGITGVSSFYSNGDTQESLRASVGIEGQLGHFSRSYLDYTGFNLVYSQGIRGSESPFKFDRFVDQSTLSVGIIQQIYGPFRLGFQTSWNLKNSDRISTDYIVEYSRRTHNVILRYNPVLKVGSIGFKITDFNWDGDAEPLDNSDIQSVEQGVERE